MKKDKNTTATAKTAILADFEAKKEFNFALAWFNILPSEKSTFFSNICRESLTNGDPNKVVTFKNDTLALLPIDAAQETAISELPESAILTTLNALNSAADLRHAEYTTQRLTAENIAVNEIFYMRERPTSQHKFGRKYLWKCEQFTTDLLCYIAVNVNGTHIKNAVRMFMNAEMADLYQVERIETK